MDVAEGPSGGRAIATRRPGWSRPFTVVLLLVLCVFAASFVAGRLGLLGDGTRPLSREKVAVIFIEGILSDSRDVIREMRKYRNREDVKALVFRIESPGGAVGSAQEIYAEIRKLQESKTVLASLGNVAASGGYYIASAAHEIVANPGTITGSIGVVFEYPNIQELARKIGWRTEILTAGRFKDIGNPMRDITPEEKDLLQSVLQNIHEQFIRDVAQGRNLPVGDVRPYAEGQIFSGERAREIGLVDRLGNLQDAVDRAAELAGIVGEPEVVYPEEKKPRLWEYLLQGALGWVEGRLREAFEESVPSGFRWWAGLPSIAGR